MAELDNTADILDIRDLIERFEELETQRDEVETEALEGHAAFGFGKEERDELAALESFLSDFKSYGGDHEWRGDWYPVTLIRDSYFVEYAQELAEDSGAINSEAGWPNGFIDWDRAAEALQMDYTTGEFDGVTYWAR